MIGIHISLLNVVCFTYLQNVVARKHGRMISNSFLFLKNTKMNNYNIVVIVFRSNFEGEMSSLIPSCVHKKECLKKI